MWWTLMHFYSFTTEEKSIPVTCMLCMGIYRGYYMAERRYTRIESSCLQAAMSCSIYYKNTNEIPNHFTLILLCCERYDLFCSHSNGDLSTCDDNLLIIHVCIISNNFIAFIFDTKISVPKQWQMKKVK